MEPTTYETPGPVHLEIRVPSGDVSVQAAAISQTTLEISGERSPDEISVVFEAAGDGHRLVVEQRKRGQFGWTRGRDLNVRVTVPDGSHVQVAGGSTDLNAQGTIGSLSFHSGSGDANIEHVVGDAEAKVASGDLHIETVGGTLSFHSASGDVTAGVVVGRAMARTASGDVKIATVTSKAKVTTVSGDIALSSLLAGGSASLQAVSGDIVVGVPRGTNVFLDLSSVSGSTSSDLPVSDSPSGEAGGTEDSEITAATVSGDISVRHSRD